MTHFTQISAQNVYLLCFQIHTENFSEILCGDRDHSRQFLGMTISSKIYATNWATFKLKKKKTTPKKFFYVSENGTFFPRKATFSKFLAPNVLLTLDKTILGDIGCLSNLYYLLAAQASRIHSQNCSLKKCIFENFL